MTGRKISTREQILVTVLLIVSRSWDGLHMDADHICRNNGHGRKRAHNMAEIESTRNDGTRV